MTLEQMYAAIGGDYKGVMERLPSADFVRRFALKFLQDDSFPNLKKALEAQDAPTACRPHPQGRLPEPWLRCPLRPRKRPDRSTPRRHAGRRRYPLPSRGEGVSAGRGGVEGVGVKQLNLSVCFAASSPTEGSLWRRGKAFRHAKASPR